MSNLRNDTDLVAFDFVAPRRKRKVSVKKLEGTDDIDIADLDSRIALAGAPNRKTFRSNPTYKRRGPASPTLLPIYRDAL